MATAGGVDGDREAQAFRDGAGAGIADDQGIDADDRTGEIHQRTTGVTLVDGGIGLDQTFDLEAVAGVDGTPGSANHTDGHGVLEIAEEGNRWQWRFHRA